MFGLIKLRGGWLDLNHMSFIVKLSMISPTMKCRVDQTAGQVHLFEVRYYKHWRVVFKEQIDE